MQGAANALLCDCDDFKFARSLHPCLMFSLCLIHILHICYLIPLLATSFGFHCISNASAIPPLHSYYSRQPECHASHSLFNSSRLPIPSPCRNTHLLVSYDAPY